MQSYDWLPCVQLQKQRKTQCQGRIWTNKLMPVQYIDTDVVRHKIKTPHEGYVGMQPLHYKFSKNHIYDIYVLFYYLFSVSV